MFEAINKQLEAFSQAIIGQANKEVKEVKAEQPTKIERKLPTVRKEYNIGGVKEPSKVEKGHDYY